MQELETDYLIIGAGATGLAFADTLLDETDAHITIVDRHGQPGGHWNDAYPFVTLHQPSSWYGVNSMELGSGRKDSIGLNAGMYELATGAEVNGYFSRLLTQRFLPSGHVHYRPMSNYVGDGVVQSLLSGEQVRVKPRRKTVFAAVYGPKVPSVNAPRYAVAPGVRLVPPNALPGLWQAAAQGPLPRHFVIVGAGKTAMDAVNWLLQAGADANAITWVMPRDPWIMNRLGTQPGQEFFAHSIGGQADRMAAIAQASSADDMFVRMEASGVVVRIDPSRTPTMFHQATISLAELQQLRRIRNVIRLGRVQRLEVEKMVLDQGEVQVAPDTLFIDCSASAVDLPPTQPIFQGNSIVLNMVRMPAVSFSAALLAFVEAHYGDDAQKNALCRPIPFPHTPKEYAHALLVHMGNQFGWSKDPALSRWILNSRLDGYGRLLTGITPEDTEKLAIIARLKEATKAAVANLQKLVAA